MKKKFLIALTLVFVLAFAVPAVAAFNGLTDTQKQQILDLQKQASELRKQIVDKYVEAGQITADQGKAIKERIDKAEKYRQDNNILPGQGLGQGNCAVNGGCIAPGAGCGGYGCGNAVAGAGGGKRGFGGGPVIRWNNSNVQ